MKIVRSPGKMRLLCQGFKGKHKTIGFVPTMGALHRGHLKLISKARRENDIVAVSIFVNPAQFSPKEDFKRYPRKIKEDSALCRRGGVDIIFIPQAQSIYPAGYKTYVCVEGISDKLCGRFRKGHFMGVATIVAKLFNIVNPDVAYFGQKDAQQAVIIKKMVEDLNMPLTVRIVPTQRQSDGLALSSRNAYLKPGERRDARVLFQALSFARDLVKKGLRDTAEIISRMRKLILKRKNARIEYISIVDEKELLPVKRVADGCLIALAVRIGKTRLIDNIIIRI